MEDKVVIPGRFGACPGIKLVIRSNYHMGLMQKIFGTHSENELKRIYPIVDEVEALEPVMQKLSDSELKDNCLLYTSPSPRDRG